LQSAAAAVVVGKDRITALAELKVFIHSIVTIVIDIVAEFDLPGVDARIIVVAVRPRLTILSIAIPILIHTNDRADGFLAFVRFANRCRRRWSADIEPRLLAAIRQWNATALAKLPEGIIGGSITIVIHSIADILDWEEAAAGAFFIEGALHDAFEHAESGAVVSDGHIAGLAQGKAFVDVAVAIIISVITALDLSRVGSPVGIVAIGSGGTAIAKTVPISIAAGIVCLTAQMDRNVGAIVAVIFQCENLSEDAALIGFKADAQIVRLPRLYLESFL